MIVRGARWRRWLAATLAVAALATILCAQPLLRAWRATLLLTDIAGRPLPVWLDWRPAVACRSLRYSVVGHSQAADLCRPLGPVRAGLVLVHGAAPEGKADPRLQAFARHLARAGFAVLVPDVPALRELRLSAASAADVRDAFTNLLDHADWAPQGRAGIAAISVAVGPALLAAQDPRIAGRVRFFLAVGAYYDLPRTLIYLITGRYAADGLQLTRPPNRYGKWVVTLSNAAELPDPVDRATLSAIARRRLRDPDAPIADLVGRLTSAGRAVYAFVTATDPQRAAALLTALPAPVRANIDALNLATLDLRRLQARLIVVHGRDDHLIPYPESIALAGAVPPGHSHLFLLDGLHHVDTTPKSWDVIHLWRALYTLLGEQDRSN